MAQERHGRAVGASAPSDCPYLARKARAAAQRCRADQVNGLGYGHVAPRIALDTQDRIDPCAQVRRALRRGIVLLGESAEPARRSVLPQRTLQERHM